MIGRYLEGLLWQMESVRVMPGVIQVLSDECAKLAARDVRSGVRVAEILVDAQDSPASTTNKKQLVVRH
jgi:hypothetical protein